MERTTLALPAGDGVIGGLVAVAVRVHDDVLGEVHGLYAVRVRRDALLGGGERF